jgi:hypothetical protein
MLPSVWSPQITVNLSVALANWRAITEVLALRAQHVGHHQRRVRGRWCRADRSERPCSGGHRTDHDQQMVHACDAVRGHASMVTNRAVKIGSEARREAAEGTRRNELEPVGPWPEKPEPVDPGDGTRADRRRMLQHMRETWGAVNTARRDGVIAEVKAARERRAEVAEYWAHHKDVVQGCWKDRTGRTTVADIPEVAAQWHPANPGAPEKVAAMAQQRGTASPYLWQCPLGLGHPPWQAWPKDRIQSGTRCPACQHLTKLIDVPTLAEQYAGSVPADQLSFGAHDRVPWTCRTWALDPDTGHWDAIEHHFDAVVKDRSQQGHGCRVCAGYVVDDTNSLATWFPELAEQFDDPSLDPRRLPTSTHNVSRKDLPSEGPAGQYATYPWRCPHGHQWPSTILNRVQGGDCPNCSTSGISKEQVHLVAELACLMELIEPDRPDPRLPHGVPNFASHKVTIPAHLKPPHWRYKDVEVDARFFLPSHRVVIGLEYDGAYHHSSKVRDRSTHEAEKSTILKKAGAAAVVVHVRVGNLVAIEAPYAITVPVPERSTVHERAIAVAAAVEARYPGSIPELAGYQASGQVRGQAQAHAYIIATWGELRPPRAKPQRTTPRKQRPLKATAPHPDSLLVPIGDPYRNLGRPAEIRRDYRCACGTERALVQAQVTSGNTRSCGCLREQANRQRQPAVSRAETQAAREWSRQAGITLGDSGRLPGRVIASYRLQQAGRTDVLGADGLLDEKHVREWARDKDRPLGARNRLPSDLWLDFTKDYLT